MLLHAFAVLVFICLRPCAPPYRSRSLSLSLSLAVCSCLLGKNAVTFYVCTLPLSLSPFADTPFGILLDLDAAVSLSLPLSSLGNSIAFATHFDLFFTTFLIHFRLLLGNGTWV